MTQFASVDPKHFEGTIEYGCRIHGEECYGCAYESEVHTPFEPHNRVNPILLDIRAHLGGFSWANMLWALNASDNYQGAYITKDYVRIENTDQIQHARRVLTRLANLEGSS